MRRVLTRSVAIAAATLVLASNMFGQMAQQYRQAAQLWRNVQCSVPADQNTANQYASYYDCLANQLGPGGGSLRCTAPSGSTASCGSGGSSSTGGAASSSPNIPLANTGNAKADLALNGLGLLLKLKMAHDAQKAAEGQPQNQASNGAGQDDSAAQLAAQQAAEQQKLNDEAAQILHESNTLLASNAGAGPPLPDSSPGSTAAIGALLDSDTSTQDSSSAINALLDSPNDQNTPTSTTANAVASLLDSDSQADQSVAGASIQPTAQAPVPANLLPQNQQVNAALQDSVDQPDPSQTGSLAGMLQSAGQEVKDTLNGMVTSAKTLASDLMNDPVVQWATSDKGSLTTAPLPAQGDSADIATNKVYGQSVVGFGDLLKGLAGGPAKFADGLYTYGTNMVNQMGADLGLASSTIFEPAPGVSQ
jgi:hypothetical protein